MKKLFATPAAIEAETNHLQADEKFRREDRATVSRFFNGAPPLTDEEAQALGITVNVNHLFGFKQLQDASDQVFGLYTKPSNLVEIDLDAAPAGKRADWGMKVSSEASRVFKKIKPFKTAYRGVSGDGAMHGEGAFFFHSKTFPLPKQVPLSKILVPSDASTDTRELTHWGIETTLGLPALHRYWKATPKGWNKDALQKVMQQIYDNKGEYGRIADPKNAEELEYARQQNSGKDSKRKVGVDVVYFYQQRCDLPGNPHDLTISLANCDGIGDGKGDAKKGMVLFEQEAALPRVDKCLHPFFMDTIIGGAPKWHRVLGTGHLNYQLNHAIELMVNRAQQATMEGSMNLWQARDTTTREAVQEILLKHNGVIPEGLDMIQNRYQPNFAGLLDMVQFFRQAGSKNVSGVTPNNGQQNDQLEVQAMAEMNQGAAAGNNRMSNWYDYLDGMYEEAFSRLTDIYIDPQDEGYSEIKDFQDAMARAGIPLWWLQRANVRVRATRIVGDGLRSKELGVVSFLSQNRNQYAPEVQPKITRLVTGLALDNYALAEELTPIQEEPDSPQLMRADSENAIMLTTRRPVAAKADDIDELHILQHFPALEILISDGLQYQKAAFTPQQGQAFQVIGAHIVMHIQRIEGRAMNSRQDPEREKARQFMDQLNKMAAMGEKLMNNMQQAQEGQGQEMDPTEQAKLQLQIEALSLQREKLSFSVEKFQRTQGNREQSEAFRQNLQLEKDRRDGIVAQHNMATRDVESAVKIATAKKPDSQSA